MILTVFCGCGKDAKTDKNSSEDLTVDVIDSGDVFSSEPVSFTDADGDPLYYLVKAEECSDEISDAVSSLFKAIKKEFKSSKIVCSDKEPDDGKYEIIVGKTSRAESSAAYGYLRSDGSLHIGDFVIGTIGKKITIIGVDDAATAKGVEYFIENILKSDKNGQPIFYRNIPDVSVENAKKINGVALTCFKVVRPHYNSSYLTQLEIEALKKTVESETGCIFEIVEDAYEQPGKFEIIVGNTNREGVEKIDDYDAFSIKIDGSKVYLNGGHNYSTAMAVSEFAKLIAAGDVTDSSSTTGSYAKTVASYDKTKLYTPAWWDDFNGTEIDLTKWSVQNGGASAAYNNKKSTRSSDPAITGVENGLFHIRPTQDETTYYGGLLNSQSHMNFKYGYVEISEKIPNAHGFWTALWTCSGDPTETTVFSPEIDINESFGNGNVVAANCHAWPREANPIAKENGYTHYSLDGSTYGSKKRRYSLDNRSFNDDFHTFGFLWTDDTMAFTCDGEIYFSYKTNTKETDIEAFVNHSMYFKLSMAVGFANNGDDISLATADDWQSDKCCLYADHLYVYQLDDGKSEMRIS